MLQQNGFVSRIKVIWQIVVPPHFINWQDILSGANKFNSDLVGKVVVFKHHWSFIRLNS